MIYVFLSSVTPTNTNNGLPVNFECIPEEEEEKVTLPVLFPLHKFWLISHSDRLGQKHLYNVLVCEWIKNKFCGNVN